MVINVVPKHNKTGDISGEASPQIFLALAIYLAAVDRYGGVYAGIVDLLRCPSA